MTIKVNEIITRLGFNSLESSKKVTLEIKAALEEAYQAGIKEANLSWLSEALNSGDGTYKP